ncbi:hypothetical protein [Litoribrevibacter albus]|uniref:Uncharacterized protein n=1 Tax=Litoribrevibacter albus TaxID=1473156 RepID=A0AA37W651_9GAMM|nr:hypothetical protein [Litoribrevibacter albus]GLQ29549.1 hypothetical protein GCM10007876_00270 [Litoribrevibacter albus]
MQIQNGVQTSQQASQVNGITQALQNQGTVDQRARVDSVTQVADDQVTLSASATDKSSAQARAVAKYEDMTRVYSTVVAPEEKDEASATTLEGFEPIKLFNADDVAAYEEKLSLAFAKAGVDTSQDIDLAIDYEGNVYVKNDHPDKEKIEQLFKEDRDLQQGLIQTQDFYLFKELYRLTQEWAQKIDSGMSEEMAGQWLLSSSKQAQKVSGEGLTFREGGMVDPFERSGSNAVALSAYAG